MSKATNPEKITVKIKNAVDHPESGKSEFLVVLKDNAQQNVKSKYMKDGETTFDKSDLGDQSNTFELISPDYDADPIVVTPNEYKTEYGFLIVPKLSNVIKVENMADTAGKPEPLSVKLTPSTGPSTTDQFLWNFIKGDTLDFLEYQKYINAILNCNLGFDKKGYATRSEDDIIPPGYTNHDKNVDKKRLPFHRTEAYSLLKYATERYVESKFKIEHEDYEHDPYFVDDSGHTIKKLPYYNLIEAQITEYLHKHNNDLCDHHHKGFLNVHSDATFIELIWSYWHEQGMMVGTINALAKRFQNIRNGARDPLGNFELDPLRPLNNIIWGYIQDTQHRLTSPRRMYEYAGQYGLDLGTQPPFNFNPADRRSNFLQAFNKLLSECVLYYRQADNTTIRPDAFGVLNALRELHRILAEGAHNQFGDLPTVARTEMLIEQWILARPEVREFLGGRVMVPYDETWMDRVDSMKALQGWDNTSISFYHDLAVHGEKILLGVRFGNWTRIDVRDNAQNWADAFRDSVQRYIHSYYAVTGIDLAADTSFNMNASQKNISPSILIHEKMQRERMIRRS